LSEATETRSLVVIDEITGEVVSAEYTLRHRNQDEAYRKVKEAERSVDGRQWIAGYHDPIRDIIKDLSLIEAGAIVKLLPYLQLKSNGKLIVDGKPLKQSDIQRIFKRGKDATRAILDRLKDIGVITVEKNGRSNVYFISAEFHTMGNVKEGERFTKLYKVKTRQITEDLDLNEAGLLYKILPFFHYAEYYLCENPNEPDPEIIRHMDRELLAEAIGHDRATVSGCVTKLVRKGAILVTRSGKTTRYLVHPDVMYRQKSETEWTQSVRKLFEQHMRK
jgi:predicted transcriptional regulator